MTFGILIGCAQAKLADNAKDKVATNFMVVFSFRSVASLFMRRAMVGWPALIWKIHHREFDEVFGGSPRK